MSDSDDYEEKRRAIINDHIEELKALDITKPIIKEIIRLNTQCNDKICALLIPENTWNTMRLVDKTLPTWKEFLKLGRYGQFAPVPKMEEG